MPRCQVSDLKHVGELIHGLGESGEPYQLLGCADL